MTEFDNTSEQINENFDTIKTLLNSIRAQGILNTSDVDKLLTGINSKLEKINTEEDIDIIKLFLTELKQSLEERHGVLLSKFGAIESLFANLLKNSSEMMKTSEIKEMFDIVATNLSVFSREVVSQKESLTDINMKLEALRSDDSQKKDIIKNITLLKPDLERLSNGFDTIVLSLNDNFKALAKTIMTIDKTEYLDKFSESIANIEMSSNTLLSALQMLDKKTESVEDILKNLSTKDDINKTSERLFEITAQGHELKAILDDLNTRYVRIDNLSDKIDASVNIIANLKYVLEDSENQSIKNIVNKLDSLESELKLISSDNKFEEFKTALGDLLKDIIEKTNAIDENLTCISDLKEYIDNAFATNSKLFNANIDKVLSDINNEALTLANCVTEAKETISGIFDKNFTPVYQNIDTLKTLISQIDENSTSGRNAIFSSISDRLVDFETTLKSSLQNQDKIVSEASLKLVEQVDNIKDLSGVLDYKLDASVVEIGNVKREFTSLKSSVDDVLALDFINVIKDLRVDVYASMQETVKVLEENASQLNQNTSTDITEKYGQLISRLDSIEAVVKQEQVQTMTSLKGVLDSISSSLVDVLSYVSDSKMASGDDLDYKLSGITNIVKENTLDYIEAVRASVDVIKVQIEADLKIAKEENLKSINEVKAVVHNSKEELKEDLKNSYAKLLEVQDLYAEIKDLLAKNGITYTDKFNSIINSSEDLKSDFQNKADILKAALLDKIEEFKQQFTCENADKISELKFSVDNANSQNTQNLTKFINDMHGLLDEVKTDSQTAHSDALTKLLENFTSLKEFITSLNVEASQNISKSVDDILSDLNIVKTKLTNVDENVDSDMSRQLSLIESSFDAVANQITDILGRSNSEFFNKVENEFSTMSLNVQDVVVEKLNLYKTKIEECFDTLKDNAISQSGYLKDNIDSLNSALKNILDEQAETNSEHIESIINNIRTLLDENSKNSAEDIELLKDSIRNIAEELSVSNKTITTNKEILNNRINEILNAIVGNKNVLTECSDDFAAQLASINTLIKGIISKDDIKLLLDEQSEKYTETINSISANTTDIYSSFKENINESLNNSTQNLNLLRNEVINSIEKNSDEINVLKSDIAVFFKNSLNDLINDNGNVVELLRNDIFNANATLSALINDNTTQQNSIKHIITSEFDNMFKSIENTSAERNKIKEIIFDKLQNIANDIQDKSAELNLLKDGLYDKIEGCLAEIKNNIVAKDLSINSIIAKLDTLSADFGSKYATNNEDNNLILSKISTNNESILDLVQKLTEELNSEKEIILSNKDFISETITKNLKIISKGIEKETDIIISELNDQFDIIKQEHSDDISALSAKIDDVISSHIYNNIEDLKSYLDVKTDNTYINEKLDSFKNSLHESVNEITAGLNKMLASDVFTSTMSDYRLATELLINSAVDRLNDKFENFIKDDIEIINASITKNSSELENKFNLFDKKFIETLTDKYEEIKLLSNTINSSLDEVHSTMNDVISSFTSTKDELSNKIDALSQDLCTSVNSATDQIKALNDSFDNLRSQISNKSFDEAFQASINKQIASLEELMTQQLGYVQDINDLCADNLPEVPELTTLLRTTVLDTVKSFSKQLEDIDVEAAIDNGLKQLKTDLINQFLHIFNQISFVTEQEEILDFIQDKHAELIEILSHIVTSTDSGIKYIRNEISEINRKISSIMSSDDNIDYVYSLQDIESDIANLRLAIKDVKESNPSKEIDELAKSTNQIYELVIAIKDEIPNKRDFENIAEDIVSISARTNKLILASDESYKTLQDNLQDFKLVINDLDERTRNFSRESGIDKLDTKINAINSMVTDGVKTNKVFNQIFEYLAEWVDNAGEQINVISNKINSLDDIEQIKTMLSDLKSNNNDNTETEELVDALEKVFNKQTKRIVSLETKLDKIIVSSVAEKSSLNASAIESSLNKILNKFEDKIVEQQEKINLLEGKLSDIISGLDTKDTAQLTKKIGGMDKQIAKLNKNIEKIASNVISK